jgi:hypothetical protein
MGSGLGWNELWPVFAFCFGLLASLIAVIWRMHQKEIDALHAHIQRIEHDLDQFRRVELKAIQDGFYARMDQVLIAITDLKVDLARSYMPRTEVANALAALKEDVRRPQA